MNKEVKEKWVAALKSDKYEQGVGFLSSHDGSFCCLGVLCDLFINEHSDKAEWNEDGEVVDKVYGAVHNSFLPLVVHEWADLPSEPRVDEEPLTYLNDSVGLSFNEIADLINKHL